MTTIPSIKLVIECASEHFGIPVEVLTNIEYKAHNVTRARHTACYVSRILTYKSFGQIESEFSYAPDAHGGASGAAYAFNKISKLVINESDPTATDVTAICALVRKRLPAKLKAK